MKRHLPARAPAAAANAAARGGAGAGPPRRTGVESYRGMHAWWAVLGGGGPCAGPAMGDGRTDRRAARGNARGRWKEVPLQNMQHCKEGRPARSEVVQGWGREKRKERPRKGPRDVMEGKHGREYILKKFPMSTLTFNRRCASRVERRIDGKRLQDMRSRRGSLIDARGAGLRHDRGDGRCRGGGRRRRSSLLWLDSVSEVEGQVRPEITKKQMCTYLSGTTLFRQSVFPGFCLRQSVFPVTVVGLAGDD